MKHMKKAFALMLAMVMVMAMAVTSFATEGTGSITINGVTSDNVYSIYKILELASYNKETGRYSYKVDENWKPIFETATDEQGQHYFTIDTLNYVAWTYVGEKNDNESLKAYAGDFAKQALAYAKTHNPKIEPLKSTANAGDYSENGTSITFSGLELGYYLVDSTMGALCGLTTTNPTASINAKNGAPTMEKEVLVGNQWKTANTASISDTINFRLDITVYQGAENYIIHDKFDDSFTFLGITKIEHELASNGSIVETDEDYYTVATNGLTDNCDFEIVFTPEFCEHLATNDHIYVYYSATLDEDASVTSPNVNTAWLDFGEDHSTTPTKTETTTYGFDIVKTDDQNTLLPGAHFLLYTAASGGNIIPVVRVENDDVDFPVYRRALENEEGEEIVAPDGIVRLLGFDKATYYLHETVAPAGFNPLENREPLPISENRFATFNDGVYSVGSAFRVVNRAGSMLPETGGMGTVMFITCGSIVVMAAGVLLVTKKRMSMIQD